MKKFVQVVCVLFSFSIVLACGAAEDDQDVNLGSDKPQVLDIENAALVVGESVSFYGQNFLTPEQGKTNLVFRGTFIYDDNGQAEDIGPYVISPLYDGMFTEPAKVKGTDGTEKSYPAGTHVLRWNRFGPFDVPFTKNGDRVGTFKGTVQAINHYKDGPVIESTPTTMDIEIKPSIIITRLEPVIGFNEDGSVETAKCGSPALRGHTGMPYVLEVKAIGFQPDYFIYKISGANEGMQSDKMADGWVTYTHKADPAQNGVDRLGDPQWPTRQSDEILVFNGIDDNADVNIAGITVTATKTENGKTTHIYTALPLTIVRPLQFFHDGREELAEYYEPVVVHPSIPGSIGTKVCYTEGKQESRQRAVSISVSKSFQSSQTNLKTSGWAEGIATSETKSETNSEGIAHSEGESTSESYGTSYNASESNNVNFQSQKGSNWGWNKSKGTSAEDYTTESGEVFGSVSTEVSTSASAEGSIPGFAKVSGTVGTKLGVQGGGKKGNTVGEKTGSKQENGEHMYQNESASEAFGSTTTEGKSESISGTFAVQSQNTINKSKAVSAATSNSQTFSTNQTEGVSKGVVEGESEQWSETFVDAEAYTTSLNVCASIPNGACATVYRQTVRYVKTAYLYAFDLCGVRSLAGEMYFNNWKWVPDIQQGVNCSKELPPSRLPKAECFIGCE